MYTRASPNSAIQVVTCPPIRAIPGIRATPLSSLGAVRCSDVCHGPLSGSPMKCTSKLLNYYKRRCVTSRSVRTAPPMAQSTTTAIAPRPFLTPSQLANTLAQQVYTDWRNTYVKDAESKTGAPAGSKYVRMDIRSVPEWESEGGRYPRNITTSEAIGYGMIISVLMDKEGDFRAFLKFYEHFKAPLSQDLMSFQIAETADYGLMESKNGNANSATDGDLDVAYALFLATERGWTGKDYNAKGKKICAALAKFCIDSGTKLPKLGDWATEGVKLRETGTGADQNSNRVTRTSDWMLGHFRKFSQFDTSRSSFWTEVLDKAREAYIGHYNDFRGAQGLVADFHVFDTGLNKFRPVKGKILEKDPEDGHFGFNACRVPWRLAAYLKDIGETQARAEGIYEVMQAQKEFFKGELRSGRKVIAGYRLDLSPSTPNNIFQLNNWSGPALALLKAMNSGSARELEKDVTRLYKDNKGYYQDTVLLCSLLQSM